MRKATTSWLLALVRLPASRFIRSVPTRGIAFDVYNIARSITVFTASATVADRRNETNRYRWRIIIARSRRSFARSLAPSPAGGDFRGDIFDCSLRVLNHSAPRHVNVPGDSSTCNPDGSSDGANGNLRGWYQPVRSVSRERSIPAFLPSSSPTAIRPSADICRRERRGMGFSSLHLCGRVSFSFARNRRIFRGKTRNARITRLLLLLLLLEHRGIFSRLTFTRGRNYRAVLAARITLLGRSGASRAMDKRAGVVAGIGFYALASRDRTSILGHGIH